ncbi:MAG: molybdate ABC transporter substrate-binding protein [Rhodospirillaceae bacterium]|nr:molybdate ABC transporter substrate-binding protein [Rhodospirillaceae bacterium]
MNRFLAACFAVLIFALPALAAADARLLVFAAASLSESLTEAGKAYAAQGHPAPSFSFAASSALARQIENGAPAALFLSADEAWMDYLAARKLIAADSRISLLGNTLVLVAPADHPLNVTIAPGFDLAKALAGGKLAMADPDSVPAGKYGRAALEKLGAWTGVSSAVIRGENVRTALAFVERGEAAAGIVYGSDAALTQKVRVAGVFPADSHPAISYPVAAVAGHDSAAARAFLAFLKTPAAKEIFKRYGFTAP